MRENPPSAGVAPEEGAPGDTLERLVEIRCGFAEMAQREAEAAAARAVEARGLYQKQSAALVGARSEVDPGVTQTDKEAAHSSFRAAVAAARSRGQVEAAAVAWLAQISRINSQSRSALARIEHGHARVNALRSELSSLADAAEAAEAMAVAAMEACRAARAALDAQAAAEAAAAPADGAWTPQVAELAARARARAAEAANPAVALPPPGESQPAPTVPAERPITPEGRTVEEDPPSPDSLAIDLSSPRPQVIIRLVRRDSRAMGALVEHLAAGDPAARAAWQLTFSNFVDSIFAAAIDDASFEFPPGNPFWDQFSAAESREITRGLAALGYRCDGFEGFVDGRILAQRDLAMALGQAGFLPVKVRHWPTAEESTHLFRGVIVSADRFIAVRAPGLTLGELVRVLGRRAEPLADLWNDWPRCRPLLLSSGL